MILVTVTGGTEEVALSRAPLEVFEVKALLPTRFTVGHFTAALPDVEHDTGD